MLRLLWSYLIRLLLFANLDTPISPCMRFFAASLNCGVCAYELSEKLYTFSITGFGCNGCDNHTCVSDFYFLFVLHIQSFVVGYGQSAGMRATHHTAWYWPRTWVVQRSIQVSGMASRA